MPDRGVRHDTKGEKYEFFQKTREVLENYRRHIELSFDRDIVHTPSGWWTAITPVRSQSPPDR